MGVGQAVTFFAKSVCLYRLVITLVIARTPLTAAGI